MREDQRGRFQNAEWSGPGETRCMFRRVWEINMARLRCGGDLLCFLLLRRVGVRQGLGPRVLLLRGIVFVEIAVHRRLAANHCWCWPSPRR